MAAVQVGEHPVTGFGDFGDVFQIDRSSAEIADPDGSE
jgi:hypothetical protein